MAEAQGQLDMSAEPSVPVISAADMAAGDAEFNAQFGQPLPGEGAPEGQPQQQQQQQQQQPGQAEEGQILLDEGSGEDSRTLLDGDQAQQQTAPSGEQPVTAGKEDAATLMRQEFDRALAQQRQDNETQQKAMFEYFNQQRAAPATQRDSQGRFVSQEAGTEGDAGQQPTTEPQQFNSFEEWQQSQQQQQQATAASDMEMQAQVGVQMLRSKIMSSDNAGDVKRLETALATLDVSKIALDPLAVSSLGFAEKPLAVLEHLATNQHLASTLERMTPVEQIYRLAQIHGRVTSQKRSAATAPKQQPYGVSRPSDQQAMGADREMTVQEIEQTFGKDFDRQQNAVW